MFIEIKPYSKTIQAALHDLGDGIALFEFRTKNATLNTELVQSLEQSISIIQEDYEGMVISHWGANFALVLI